MFMGRPLLKFLLLLAASALLCAAAYRVAGHCYAKHLAGDTDDLAWLRLEFRLSEPELQRIRQLHVGYQPTCQEFCRRIAEEKRGLNQLLDAGTPSGALVEEKLKNVALLRAQCQAAMLAHFDEVSRVMPAEQGRRYLSEMRRITLGAHEKVEERMSSDAPSPHGHH